MPSLQIRDLPSDLYEILSARAEREGRSLAQQAIVELRKIAEYEARTRRLETVERIAHEIDESGFDEGFTPPVQLVREDRER